MATRMQQRRGTESQWTTANPILNAGEIGFESDTNKFKIGDGINHWDDLTYFTDAAGATAAITDLIDGAPAALNTLNEIAAAINDDPNFFTTIATNLSNHESDTTNIHGIADTSALATKTYADNAASTAAAAIVASAPSTLDTLNELAAALGNDANYASTITTALGLKAPLASPTFTGTVTIPNGAVLATPGSATLTNATGLPLTTGVTGTLPIANGGTGATTASTAAAALLPSQTSNSGKYLTTDGSGTLSWGTVSGYSAPTLGSTSIASGATVTTIAGLTASNLTLTGTLTANSSAGTSGYVLTSTGTGVQWAAVPAGGADTNMVIMGAY